MRGKWGVVALSRYDRRTGNGRAQGVVTHWLGTADAARHLGLRPGRIRAEFASGRLDGSTFGPHTLRFKREHVDALMNSHVVPARRPCGRAGRTVSCACYLPRSSRREATAPPRPRRTFRRPPRPTFALYFMSSERATPRSTKQKTVHDRSLLRKGSRRLLPSRPRCADSSSPRTLYPTTNSA